MATCSPPRGSRVTQSAAPCACAAPSCAAPSSRRPGAAVLSEEPPAAVEAEAEVEAEAAEVEAVAPRALFLRFTSSRSCCLSSAESPRKA